MIFLMVGSMALSRASFGQGSGPILISNVGCDYGAEVPLLECIWSASDAATCTHAEDAGVRCTGENDMCGHEGAVRVGDTGSVMYGAVEICINGTWGGICGDWDNRGASVVCRQLGFSSHGTAIIYIISC